MVDVSYQMVLSTLQTVGLLVGIFYYVITLRNQQKNQEISLKNQEISLRNQELTLQSQELSRKAQEQALETRQAQLFMGLYDRWSDPETIKHYDEIFRWEWTDYDDFEERYGSEVNPEQYISFSFLARFFEGVGVLVKRKLTDPALVDDLMSGNVLDFWEKFGEPMIKIRQVRDNYPQYYEHVEYLYSVIKPIVESQHPELAT